MSPANPGDSRSFRQNAILDLVFLKLEDESRIRIGQASIFVGVGELGQKVFDRGLVRISHEHEGTFVSQCTHDVYVDKTLSCSRYTYPRPWEITYCLRVLLTLNPNPLAVDLASPCDPQ